MSKQPGISKQRSRPLVEKARIVTIESFSDAVLELQENFEGTVPSRSLVNIKNSSENTLHDQSSTKIV